MIKNNTLNNQNNKSMIKIKQYYINNESLMKKQIILKINSQIYKIQVTKRNNLYNKYITNNKVNINKQKNCKIKLKN